MRQDETLGLSVTRDAIRQPSINFRRMSSST